MIRFQRKKETPRAIARWGLAVLFALGAMTAARRASAQACCSGSSALTPGRLAPMEDALVGGGIRTSAIHGSWGTTGTYTGTPIGTRELDLEEDILGSYRFLKKGQATLLVPFVQTYRLATLHSDTGGGIGDMNLSARWDFTLAGQYEYLPGIAVLIGVTFPTGVAADQAHHLLAADTTGIGAYSGNVGVAFEQTYDHLLFNLSGILADRTSRTANGVTEQLGPQFIGFLAAGWTFDDERVIALTATYTVEPDATINGERASNTNRASLQVGIGGGLEIAPKWRLSLSLVTAPPIDDVGANNPASTTAAAYLLRSF